MINNLFIFLYRKKSWQKATDIQLRTVNDEPSEDYERLQGTMHYRQSNIENPYDTVEDGSIHSSQRNHLSEMDDSYNVITELGLPALSNAYEESQSGVKIVHEHAQSDKNNELDSSLLNMNNESAKLEINNEYVTSQSNANDDYEYVQS